MGGHLMLLTEAETKWRHARRLERTAVALFAAMFGFAAGVAFTLITINQGV